SERYRRFSSARGDRWSAQWLPEEFGRRGPPEDWHRRADEAQSSQSAEQPGENRSAPNQNRPRPFAAQAARREFAGVPWDSAVVLRQAEDASRAVPRAGCATEARSSRPAGIRSIQPSRGASAFQPPKNDAGPLR